jgi:hypothetical protein
MDQLDIAVTFDPQRGYIGTARDLRTPVVALSLGGLRRKLETLVLPDEPDIVLRLDGTRLERDRRRRPVVA